MEVVKELNYKGDDMINAVTSAPVRIFGDMAGNALKLIIGVIIVAIVILTILFIFGFTAGFSFAGLSAKQHYGTGNEFIGILQSGQDNPLIAAGDEKEGMTATEQNFPMQNAKPDANGNPTVMPTYDGVDQFGEFKMSQSPSFSGKFYLVKDKSGKYVVDGSGNYIWVTLGDLAQLPNVIVGDIKTDWSDEKTRMAYAAKCKLSGKEDKPDPYAFYLKDSGYMANPNGPFEPFDVKTTSNQAAQIDQHLAKSMLGLA